MACSSGGGYNRGVEGSSGKNRFSEGAFRPRISYMGQSFRKAVQNLVLTMLSLAAIGTWPAVLAAQDVEVRTAPATAAEPAATPVQAKPADAKAAATPGEAAGEKKPDGEKKPGEEGKPAEGEKADGKEKKEEKVTPVK